MPNVRYKLRMERAKSQVTRTGSSRTTEQEAEGRIFELQSGKKTQKQKQYTYQDVQRRGDRDHDARYELLLGSFCW